MHGLHKMLYFERKKTVTKCFTLDVADIVNCPQYMSTWIAYTNNLIQEPDKGKLSLWLQYMIIKFDFLRFNINQERHNQSVELNMNWPQSSDSIIISKEMRHLFNCYSYYF